EEKSRQRTADSIQTALKWGEGRLVILHQSAAPANPSEWLENSFSNRSFSPGTGKSYDPISPRHFSFNSPAGACPVCLGLGQKMVFDEALVVPDPKKSLEQGAVLPWRRGGKRMISYYKGMLKGVAQAFDVSMEIPLEKVSPEFRKILLYGSGDKNVPFLFSKAGKTTKIERPFEGVIPNLERLFKESESEFTRNRLKSFMNPRFCDACNGQRLKPELLAVTLSSSLPAPKPIPAHPYPGISIMDFCGFPVNKALAWLEGLQLNEFQSRIAVEVVKEIKARLGFLLNVGLGYLTLDRESGTLSGGEAQRIRLATQIGAGLVGVLYILDEPSIGLHQRDNDRLLGTLRKLRDLGNSVIVVEHDEDTIRQADFLIDLGPGAGVRGGEIVAMGTVKEVENSPKSLTGQYLKGELSIPIPKKRIAPSKEKGWIEIRGARENNLKNIDVKIPLGTLTCVTGVSGSGKSTLIDGILRRSLFRQFYGSKENPGRHDSIEGCENLEKIIVIDQEPIGRTPRSNPATYTGMFNDIRDLFAKLPAAKVRGYERGRFSFNVKGGRCEKCQGDGLIKIEMHFLPPVYVTCEACNGRRYNRETLEITYKGLNIADVLDLTVDEAVNFFRAIPQIYSPVLTLAEVGLGYIRLGQSATTLSGGEAQRIKLATELSKKSTGKAFYILDEPTTGLHFHDVATLLDVLFKLRNAGNTLVVIEHNLDVIKTADWIIDMGPDGGDQGGMVVVEGPPELIIKSTESYTARYLAPYLRVSGLNQPKSQ
ncbi:MAG: excinuclease subunit, partial [Verrucomicrobiales bacterium]|nr:excinuclease subunit [Verrucomicrobiales bacterium]